MQSVAGDGEARRDRDAEVGHLGEPGALAAEHVLHGGGAVGAALAEEIDQRLAVGLTVIARPAAEGQRDALHESSGTAVGYWPEKQAWQKRAVAAGRVEHPLEREVAQRVHAEVAADLLVAVVGGDQLLAGRRVDAVVAGPGDRRRGEPEVHLAGAGRADHLHQPPLVVPRTSESSTMTTDLPSITSRTGLNLIFTLATRTAWVGLMKVRPT